MPRERQREVERTISRSQRTMLKLQRGTQYERKCRAAEYEWWAASGGRRHRVGRLLASFTE